MKTRHDIATNVNRFGQSVCGPETVVLRGKSKAAANMGLAIAGGKWLIEVLCFYFTFVLADSFVLGNARHRQAPKRQAVK